MGAACAHEMPTGSVRTDLVPPPPDRMLMAEGGRQQKETTTRRAEACLACNAVDSWGKTAQ